LCIGRTLYGLTAQIAIIRALDDVMSVARKGIVGKRLKYKTTH
jgi:hypothetical protein